MNNKMRANNVRAGILANSTLPFLNNQAKRDIEMGFKIKPNLFVNQYIFEIRFTSLNISEYFSHTKHVSRYKNTKITNSFVFHARNVI